MFTNIHITGGPHPVRMDKEISRDINMEWSFFATTVAGRRLRDPHFSPLCCQELTSKFVEVKWS